MHLDSVTLGQVLAGYTLTLGAEATGILLSGFVDSEDVAGLQTLLSALRSTITTGDGDDVVSGVVLANFKTHGGNDHLFSGIVDATLFVDAFVSAGFSVPTAQAALAAAGASLEGGAGDDTYYFVGRELGHLTVSEFAPARVGPEFRYLGFLRLHWRGGERGYRLDQ